MAVREAALDVEALAGQHMGLVPERLTDELDRLGRQVREVGASVTFFTLPPSRKERRRGWVS
ncbi:MAG: hypothetical protein ACYCVN_02505 [Acidimicrobiales bacterium]